MAALSMVRPAGDFGIVSTCLAARPSTRSAEREGRVDTGTVIGLLAGAAVALGIGILALVLSIKGLASSAEPDIRARASGGETKIGRSGLVVFLVLGVIMVIAGIALLIAALRGVS